MNMDIKPATDFYKNHFDCWNEFISLEDSDCPSCNRIGIWKSRGESGETSLLVPCFECARDSNFRWIGGYSTNGVKDNGELPDDNHTELTNKEVLSILIDDQYKKLKEEGIITPNDDSFNCIDRVLDDIRDIIETTDRCDLELSFNQIKEWWSSLGYLPVSQEGDMEYEIRFFKEKLNLTQFTDLYPEDDILDESDISEFYSSEDEGGPSSNIRDVVHIIRGHGRSDLVDDIYRFSMEHYHNLMNNIENNTDDELLENKETLCRNGINILDDIMQGEGNRQINEEQYRLLTNIFKQIYEL